ncbi:MAG: hypothetical protein Q3989_09515 [Eubacteriales bacterium]|nr:hypothetical protein [Eubacteriales bacterium]
MANCKDCVHVEVCKEYVEGLAAARGVRLSVKELDSVLECDDCKHFKDRSRFVELPCKVGDTVYFIKGGRVMSDTVIRFVIDRYAVKLTKSNGADIGYTTQFGERIFLTREEAEQALKLRERENNA